MGIDLQNVSFASFLEQFISEKKYFDAQSVWHSIHEKEPNFGLIILML